MDATGQGTVECDEENRLGHGDSGGHIAVLVTKIFTIHANPIPESRLRDGEEFRVCLGSAEHVLACCHFHI
jgi:hypothetical protein